jgi:hypothetical protein
MFYNKQFNKYIKEGTAFELDGVQYPAVWLNQATAEQKAAIGLVEVQVVGAPQNDKYYWVSTTLEEGVMTYVNTPKDLITVQELAINDINATAYSLLAPSDWMVTKSVESGTPVDASWSTFRASVRDTANVGKGKVSVATNVDEIATLVIDWPHDPNYKEPVVEEVPTEVVA